MKIKIINDMINPEGLRPQTAGAGAIDLVAAIRNPVRVACCSQVAIGSGIAVSIPDGYVGLLAPRSSTGTKKIRLANTLGIIDSDFTGEIMMIVRNNHIENDAVVIKPLERLAQLLVVPHYDYHQIEIVEELKETVRGGGSFGSTGV